MKSVSLISCDLGSIKNGERLANVKLDVGLLQLQKNFANPNLAVKFQNSVDKVFFLVDQDLGPTGGKDGDINIVANERIIVAVICKFSSKS